MLAADFVIHKQSQPANPRTPERSGYSSLDAQGLTHVHAVAQARLVTAG